MILSTAYRQHTLRDQAQELKCNLLEIAEATLYITDHPDKRLVIRANTLDSLNTSLPKTVDILINNKNIFIELSDFNDIVSLSNQLKLHGSTVPKIVMGLGNITLRLRPRQRLIATRSTAFRPTASSMFRLSRWRHIRRHQTGAPTQAKWWASKRRIT